VAARSFFGGIVKLGTKVVIAVVSAVSIALISGASGALLTLAWFNHYQFTAGTHTAGTHTAGTHPSYIQVSGPGPTKGMDGRTYRCADNVTSLTVPTDEHSSTDGIYAELMSTKKTGPGSYDRQDHVTAVVKLFAGQSLQAIIVHTAANDAMADWEPQGILVPEIKTGQTLRFVLPSDAYNNPVWGKGITRLTLCVTR
jgi:hypothetical protein